MDRRLFVHRDIKPEHGAMNRTRRGDRNRKSSNVKYSIGIWVEDMIMWII
eukprot:gene17038-19492_t